MVSRVDLDGTDPLSDKNWLEAALEGGGIGVWRWDARSGRVEWSPQLERLYGMPAGTFPGNYAGFAERVVADDLPAVEAWIHQGMTGGKTLGPIRHRIRHVDGSVRWHECRARLVRDAEQRAVGLIGTTMDVTAQVVAEESLVESTNKHRDLISAVPAIIIELDVEGRIVHINRVVDGIDAASVAGTKAEDWIVEAHRPLFREAIQRAMQAPTTIEIEIDGYGPEGTIAHYLNRIRGRWRGTQCEGVYLVCTDYSDRIEAQRALRESEARLRSAADSLPFTFWVRDAAGRLIIQNRFSLDNWGPQLGRTIAEMPLSPEFRTLAQANIARAMSGHIVREEIIISTTMGDRHFDMILAPVRDGATIIGVLGVDIDITEQRHLEERLHRSARDESVGRLAGGVAHDFNNLLTAILGYADLGISARNNPDRVMGALQRIIEAGRRGASLTGQLMAYARRQPAQLRATSTALLIERVARLAQPLLGAIIECRLDLDPDCPPVMADAVLLEQVLINLVVNARDAIAASGFVRISTTTAHLTEAELKAYPDARPGRYVRIDVEDNGSGMSPDVQRRIFEPFFTTKPVGKGTGLGLASSLGIVHLHHGIITLDSELERGSTFHIHIPIATTAVSDVESGGYPTIPGRGQLILVAEDDALIRDMAVRALEELGYRVLVASDGQAALDLVSEKQVTIDVVLTDLVMPRLGGLGLVSQLRQRQADVRVLYASGNVDETARPVLGPNDDFLIKPFTTAQLASRIAALLIS